MNANIAQPDVPNPSEDHGWTHVNGMIEPLWIHGYIIQSSMIDILWEMLDVESVEEDEKVERRIEKMCDWDHLYP